jgi:hypothetical protein
LFLASASAGLASFIKEDGRFARHDWRADPMFRPVTSSLQRRSAVDADTGARACRKQACAVVDLDIDTADASPQIEVVKDLVSPASGARHFVDAFNARDEQALRRLYHPSAVVKRPTWPSDGDVASSLDSIRLDFGAYPDGQLEIRQIIVQDRIAVVEFLFRGTNTAPLTLFTGQEVPATGKMLQLGGTIVLTFDDEGLITGERQYWDVYPLVEVWMALGVIKS